MSGWMRVYEGAHKYKMRGGGVTRMWMQMRVCALCVTRMLVCKWV